MAAAGQSFAYWSHGCPRTGALPSLHPTVGGRSELLRAVLDGDAGPIEVYWALLADQDCLAHGVDLHVDDLHSAVDLGQRLDAMERVAVRFGEPRQSP